MHGTRVSEVAERLRRVLEERDARGFAVARMVSEVDLLYGAETPAEMVARERDGSELIAAHPMVGLCLYDRRRHDTDFLLHAESEHTALIVPAAEVYRDEILAIGLLNGDTGLRVSGQVDLSNRSAFSEALARTARGSDGDILVDLSSTSYVDAGGLRLLAEAAELHPERRIVLLSPSTAIQQMLQLGGWHQLSNLLVAEGDTR